jgi:hypothetical protein
MPYPTEIQNRMVVQSTRRFARGSLRPMAVAAYVVKLVFADLAAQGVAVDSEGFRGTRLVAIAALQYAPDEFLFEFDDRFFEQNSSLDHHTDQRFQLIFHVCTLRSSDSEWAIPWTQSSS